MASDGSWNFSINTDGEFLHVLINIHMFSINVELNAKTQIMQNEFIFYVEYAYCLPKYAALPSKLVSYLYINFSDRRCV